MGRHLIPQSRRQTPPLPSLSAPFPASAELEIPRIARATTHYAVLRVPPDASRVQLKRSFRALVQVLHPDRCRLPGAEGAFVDVLLARCTLTKPVKKARYYLCERQTSEEGGDMQSGRRARARWKPLGGSGSSGR